MAATRRSLVIGLILGALACAGAAQARTSTPKSFVDDATRAIEGGRKVLVVLASPEIEAGYDDLTEGESIVLYGAILGRWLTDPTNRARAESQRPRVMPLRAALKGFDFNAPFYDAIVPIAQSANWLRAQDLERIDDASLANIERKLDEADTRQMYVLGGEYFVDYHKEQAIVVELSATILVRRIPKGQHSDARLKSDYIPYRTTFRSIVYLPDTEKLAPPAIVARWSADDGRLARLALLRGLERVRRLYSENVDATRAEVESWRKRGDRKTVERYHMLGWVVAREPDAIRFVDARSGVLCYVETLAAD